MVCKFLDKTRLNLVHTRLICKRNLANFKREFIHSCLCAISKKLARLNKERKTIRINLALARNLA